MNTQLKQAIPFSGWWHKYRAQIAAAAQSSDPDALERLARLMWDEAVEATAIQTYLQGCERGLPTKQAIAIADAACRLYRTDGRRIRRKRAPKNPPAKRGARAR